MIKIKKWIPFLRVGLTCSCVFKNWLENNIKIVSHESRNGNLLKRQKIIFRAINPLKM